MYCFVKGSLRLGGKNEQCDEEVKRKELGCIKLSSYLHEWRDVYVVITHCYSKYDT